MRLETTASAPKAPIVTRLLEELEVHGMTASELYLILLAICGAAWLATVVATYLPAGLRPAI